MLSDEQSLANGYLNTVQVPGFGPTTVVGNLVTMSETPGLAPGDPVTLGEANSEVLSSVGMSPEEIDAIETRATAVRVAAIAELLAANQMR